MENKENKRLKFSEFNFGLIKKSGKEEDFIYKLKRILDIFKNYDPNSEEFWTSIKTIVDNDDDWMSELGKVYGQGKDYAIEIYEELLEEFSNDVIASSVLLKKIAQEDIDSQIPDQTDLGNVNTQQINQDKGGFPDTSEVEASGISSGASLKAIQLIGQTSLSGVMQEINWIGVSSDQGHLGVYETELQGKGFRLNLNRIQSEISELTESMQNEVNSFMHNYPQNINDQFPNDKEMMKFNINYGGQNWTFGPEDMDVFMARNKEEIEVLVIGEVMVHEATHARGDMGEDGPVSAEKTFLNEAIAFLNNKRKVDGVLPLLLGVKGEAMASNDIFIEKSAGNWYTKKKDNIKTSGAEDILSGIIEHDSEGYPDDESQLTQEQIEELRKIGYSNYTNIRTKTDLFLKFPNTLYYSSYDLSSYIAAYGQNRSDLKILWDRVKYFGHIYSFPKIKDNFPSYILSDYIKNPSIIDEKYVYESIGSVFTEKDKYSERLYDALKKKYPDIYAVSTNISEEAEDALIDSTLQVPSEGNLEKLKILSRKDNNGDSSKKIFNKLLDHSDFFPTIERAARGGNSRLSGQSAEDILDYFTEILIKSEKGETHSYSEEGIPIVVVSQNNDDGIKNFFMIGETRVSRSVIENTIKTLEKINTDDDRYISYSIDFTGNKENLGRYQKEVYENKIRKLYQDNEDYGENSQSYEELLESQKHLMPNISADTIYLTDSEGDIFPIGKTSEDSSSDTLRSYENYQNSIFYSTPLSPVVKTSLFREWFYNKLEEHPNKNHFFLTLADNYVFKEIMSGASSHVYQKLVNNHDVVEEKDYDHKNGLPYYRTLDTEYLLINEILNLIPNEIKDNNFFEISGWIGYVSKFFSKEKVVEKLLLKNNTDSIKIIDHIDCREGFDEETKLKLRTDMTNANNEERKNTREFIPDIIRNNGKKINILDFEDLSEYIDVTLNRLLPNNDRAFYDRKKSEYVSSLESAKEEISETEVWLVDSSGFMNEIGDGINYFKNGPNVAKGFYAPRYSLMDNPCIIIYTSGGQAKGYESILKDIIGLDNSGYNGMEFGMESTLWHEISHAMMNRIVPSAGFSSDSPSAWLTNPSEILAINYGNITFLRNRLESFFREKIVDDGKIERGLIAQIKSDIIQEFPLEFYGSTREEAEANCEGILDEIAKDTAQNNLTKEQKIQLVTSVFTSFFTGMDMRSVVESEIERAMSGSGTTRRYDFKEEVIPPEKEDNWYAMKRDEIVGNLEKREDYKNFIANANKRVYNEVKSNGITNVVRPYVNNRGAFNTPTDIWSLSMLIFSPPWGSDIDIKSKNSFFSDLIPESLFTDVQEIVYRQNQLRRNWSYNDKKENVTPQEAEDAGKFMVDMQEEYGPDFVYLQKNDKSWYKTSQREMSQNVFTHNKVKNAYIKETRGGYSVGIGEPGNRVFVFVKSDDIDTNIELDGSLTAEIPREAYISLMAKRDKKDNDIEQEKALLKNNEDQRLETIRKVEERRRNAPTQNDMFPEETQKALRNEFFSNNNWYKSAEKKITIKDLNKISDDDWSRINEMMNDEGYDFRGAEDTKEIFFRLTNRSGGLESNVFPDHYNAFVSVHGPLDVSNAKRKSDPILQAKRDYGLTDNIYEAGFILPDGSLLNMSGGGSGGRALDHHEMAQYFPESDSQYEGLNSFMMLGAIRCSFGRSSSMDIAKEPTAYQYRVIESAVNGIEEFYLDLSFGDGNKVPFLYGSANPRNNGRVNSKRVINDIKNFYSQSGPIRSSKNTNWYKKSQDSGLKDINEIKEKIVFGDYEGKEDLLIDDLSLSGIEFNVIDFKNKRIITIENGNFILDANSWKIVESLEWLSDLTEYEMEEMLDFKEYDFWDDEVYDGLFCYHATNNENLSDIMKNGLEPRNLTRGITNKNTPSGVFTSLNEDDIDSYGDVIISINVGDMKKDGYTPNVDREEGVSEKDMKQAISHKLGIEYYDDDNSWDGISSETVIFFNHIPSKYLKVVEKEASSHDWYKKAQSEIEEDYEYKYPKVNGNIDGLEILDGIPNFESIASSFYDYEILPGIRRIPVSDFSGPESIFYSADDYKRSETLASDISNSNKISPLIVAIDDDGPYLLEGAHRYVALCKIGVSFFPALVVIDKDEDKTKESNMKNWYKKSQNEGKYKMKLDIPIPSGLIDIFEIFKNKGYQLLIVGGAVRDSFLHNKSKDIDVEVYGANYESLVNTLKQFGRVDIVGQAFGVIKFVDKDGNDYDFSVPRRDNKIGKGHRGFEMEFDPSIQPEEAASRRDFTINALAYDPLTHEIHDYFGGIEDLNNKILRATSPAFAEDPLRVLRGMQFAARFGFNIEPETAKMAATLKNEPLVIERVKEEWMKMFTKGKHPSKVIQYLIDTEWIDNYPELKGIVDVEQDTEWHPEGNLQNHTAHVMDAAAAIADERGIKGEARAVLLASALCHDLGKANTTRREMKNGVERVTSHGHAEESVHLTKSFLESIGIQKNIINQVVPLVGSHMKHIDFDEKSKNANVRQIAESLFPATIEQLEMVIRSDMGGRPPLEGGLPDSAQRMVDLAKEENIYNNKSQPLIQGKDIIEFYPSVPRNQFLGDALKYSYKKQLEGSVRDKDQALSAAMNYLRQKISFINGNDVLSIIGGTGGPHVGEIINNAWDSQMRGEFNNENEAMLWLESNYGNKIAKTTHWYKKSQSYSSDSSEYSDNSDIFGTRLDIDSLKEIHRLEYILFNLDQREYLNNTPKYYQMKEKLELTSSQILKKILAVYTHWTEVHTKSGWFDNHVGGILIGEGKEGDEKRGLYYINIKEQVLTKLSEEISKNLDNITGYDRYGNMLRTGIESIILSSHVPEILETKEGIEQGISFFKDNGVDQNEFEGKTEEELAYMVREKIEYDYSNSVYAEYLADNGFESKDFNIITNGEEIKESIEEVMSDEWWQYFIFETPDPPEEIDEIITDRSMHLYQGPFFYVFEEVAKTSGYDQWASTINDKKGVNAIQKTIKRISDTKELIENALSLNDIKNKMIALTIGLNTAHATGGMSQYLGLTERELEELSNLDFKPWDKELKRISKVSKNWYKIKDK